MNELVARFVGIPYAKNKKNRKPGKKSKFIVLVIIKTYTKIIFNPFTFFFFFFLQQ